MHDLGPAELTLPPDAATRSDERDAARSPRRLRRAALADVLKAEILPHIAASRRLAAPPPARSAALAADPDALARALLAGDAAKARGLLEARLASGATAQNVMLDDIAPAARKLGEAWSADDCDFFDVTAATHALGVLMRDLAPEGAARPAGAPALLVAPAPGETHTLGADIVAALFRCAGWRAARCAAEATRAELAREWRDAAGFSVSSDRCLPALAGAIAQARAAARNPRLVILVGGPVFANRPDLAEGLGADLVAADGDAASRLPHNLRRALRL